MSTEKQRRANRLNGRMGGPKTPEGKARSSRNAVKHGLTSTQGIVETNLYHETIHEMEQYKENMLRMLDPCGQIQALMAEQISNTMWGLVRISKLKQAINATTYQDLLLGERRQEYRQLCTRRSEIERSVRTLSSDGQLLREIGKDDLTKIGQQAWMHLREFLEKTMTFDRYSSEERPFGESTEKIISHLCAKHSMSISEILLSFEEYLSSQSKVCEDEQRKITAAITLIEEAASSTNISESAFFLAQHDHPFQEKADKQFIYLNKILIRMLVEYSKLERSGNKKSDDHA